MKTEIQTNVTLDIVKYLNIMMQSIKDSISQAYPTNGIGPGNFDEECAHTVLMIVKAKATSIQEFLNAITPAKPSLTQVKPEFPKSTIEIDSALKAKPNFPKSTLQSTLP